MKNNFYTLNGNNSATYIFNTSSWSSIKMSIKFYKVVSLRTKVQKYVLIFYLMCVSKLMPSRCKSKKDIETFLNKLFKDAGLFNIEKNSSVLISPTRDKVIVHKHNEYFQKFAKGQSFNKVKKEADIYKLFQPNLQNFQVSSFYDEKQEIDKQLCFFKLSNLKLDTTKSNKTKVDLVLPLVELFNTTKEKQTKLVNHLEKLLAKMNSANYSFDTIEIEIMQQIKKKFGAFKFPLGLVHRDFKPWNILNYDKLLIYDFEEAEMYGAPLEDFFNFYIDPIIYHKGIEVIVELIFDKQNIKNYKNYLTKLNLNISFEVFLIVYLLQKISDLFYENHLDATKKYQNLLIFISKNKLSIL
ncbi:aminoglycoside phosphotransferase family protein [Flavobacteriaceae bacterium]|nr:aminoglycoside phosphotransferase family protein [Flavobacteriaceae bacterium]